LERYPVRPGAHALGLSERELIALSLLNPGPATQEKTLIRASFALERYPVRPGAHALGLSERELIALSLLNPGPATQEKTLIRASFALKRYPALSGAHALRFQTKRNLPRHRLIYMQEHSRKERGFLGGFSRQGADLL